MRQEPAGGVRETVEALHDAFRAALEQWPRDGVPANPRAWLVSTGRFKAIDAIRRRARLAPLDDAAQQLDAAITDDVAWEAESVEDDRLRLIFTCCHPALASDAQVALTLREVSVSRRKKSPTRTSSPRRRSPSASCAPKRRSARRAFPTRCPRAMSSRTG